MPETSVIIPLFNGKDHIVDTIDSVFAQTYKDFEVIVVDDGSTDGSSEEVLSRYGSEIRYLRQENRGISSARNKAISAAKGKYVAFLDHDDRWLPEKLERQIDIFRRNKKIGIVYSDSFMIDEAGLRMGTLFDIEPPKKGCVFYDLMTTNFLPVITAVVEKKIFDEIGLFNSDLSIAEDWDLFLRISQKYCVDYVDEPLAEYRIHPKSFSRNRILMLKESDEIIGSYLKDENVLRDKSICNKVRESSAQRKFNLGMAYLLEKNSRAARKAMLDGLKIRKKMIKLFLGLCFSFLPAAFIKTIILDNTSVGGMHNAQYAGHRSFRKIKILYVIDSSKIGGAEYYILNLLRYLDKERFIPILICPSEGEVLELYKSCVRKIYPINTKTFSSIKAINEVSRLIEKEDVDIVHSVLFTSDLCASVASRLKNRIFIASIVGLNFMAFEENLLHRLKKRVESRIYRMAYLFADKIITVSDAVKNDLISRKGFKVNGNKVETIYCGIVQPEVGDATAIKNKYLIKEGDKVISTAATLHPSKGHIYLLKCIPAILKVFGNFKVILIGDGPRREILERTAKDLGVEKNVIFTGYLAEKEKNTILSLSDVVVLPSFWEGCPALILEAMSLKIPVVATDFGGTPELVGDREAGILIKPKDEGLLSKAIIDVMSDRDLAIRMGDIGRRRYLENFTVNNMVERTCKIYLETFRSKGKKRF